MALSGGERWRVNLALILSFRKALASLYPSTVDFCVLDDVYSALDEEGEGHVQELATELCREVSHVFIAVPRAPARNFGARIEIEKKNGVSRIVGVHP